MLNMLCFGFKSSKASGQRESRENLACIDPKNTRPQDKGTTHQREPPVKPRFNIALMGAPGVGKTDVCEILEEVDDELVVLRILDITTTFPTRYKQSNLRRPVEQSDGFVLVYSVTDRRSLAAIDQMTSYIRYVKRDRDLPVVLVGNKMDASLERCISKEEGRQLAFDLGVSFYETSTRMTTSHVTKIFHDLVRQIRSVSIRKELDRQWQGSDINVCSPFCGSRGLVDRISFRTLNRRKLLIHRNT
ncbi:hypothetical protein LSH36_1497g00016 [Paralvinella palmiformis]|uniref:small monomeric GTPase n=1 Tax=Paralvinella palmiformis TaxID=53620 RepID=A0AAD9IST9_9ANNE|nr:hypothetical protein LSH36_1497g00016 [Paralvinella palmiformis]